MTTTQTIHAAPIAGTHCDYCTTATRPYHFVCDQEQGGCGKRFCSDCYFPADHGSVRCPCGATVYFTTKHHAEVGN